MGVEILLLVALILLAILLAASLLSVYFLPSIVAWKRARNEFPAVFAVNTILGWTAIGWCIALAMALMANRSIVVPAIGGPWTGGATHVGWFPDPTNPELEHYWDGMAWNASRPRVTPLPRDGKGESGGET